MISGANGFLGSWICRVLNSEHSITALVRKNASCANLGGISNVEVLKYEEREFNEIVFGIKADAIILCDWSGVQSVHRNEPSQYLNIERLKGRLEAITSIPFVIGVGSQAELGPRVSAATEDEDDSPTTDYGIAKTQVREMLKRECASFGNQFAWARIFSTYGPLDSEDWFIPLLIRSMIDNQEFQMTKGEQCWSYLHAYDLALAFKTILMRNLQGVINVGNPTTTQIVSVAQRVATYFGKSELLRVGSIPYRPDQVMFLKPITEKLNLNDWNPLIDLENGLIHLIEWMLGKENSQIQLINQEKITFNLPTYSPKK